jgi:hypothetical protein
VAAQTRIVLGRSPRVLAEPAVEAVSAEHGKRVPLGALSPVAVGEAVEATVDE